MIRLTLVDETKTERTEDFFMINLDIGVGDCRKRIAICRNDKGQLKPIQLRCKKMSCTNCFNGERETLRKVLNFAVRHFNMHDFFTLTANPNHPNKLFDEFEKGKEYHQMINLNKFKCIKKNANKKEVNLTKDPYCGYFSHKSLSHYGTSVIESMLEIIISRYQDMFIKPKTNFDVCYNSFILTVYINEFKLQWSRYLKSIKEYTGNPFLSKVKDRTYQEQFVLGYAENINYLIALSDRIADKIKASQKESYGFQFVRVLEFQKNGNPHFHMLADYIFPSLFDFACGENRVKDLEVIEADDDKALKYILKYITKENSIAIYNYKKENNENYKFIRFSNFTNENGKSVCIRTHAEKLLGLNTDSEWQIVDFEELGIENFDNSLMPTASSKKIYNNVEELKKDLKSYKRITESPVYEKLSNFYSIKREKLHYIDSLIKNTAYKSCKDELIELRKKFDMDAESVSESFIYNICYSLLENRCQKKLVPLKRIGDVPALSKEQKSVLNSVAYNPITVVLGGAGCGKSFTLSKLNEMYDTSNLDIRGLALSSAACNVLKKYGCKKSENIYKYQHAYFEEDYFKSSTPIDEKTDILIIDESSMLNLSMLLSILLNTSQNCRLIFCGDILQLDPVTKYNSISALDLVKKIVPAIELTKNYRATPELNNICNALRNKNFEPLLSNLKEFKENEDFSKNNFVNIVPTHSLRLRINKMIKTKYDFISANERFSLGDEIMFTNNNNKFKYLNGDRGKIINFNNEFVFVKKNDGYIVKSAMDSADFCLADCITCHKSQGSEFDNVRVFIDTQKGLHLQTLNYLYTALTRARKKLEVVYVLSEAIPTKEKLVEHIKNLNFTSSKSYERDLNPKLHMPDYKEELKKIISAIKENVA